jgi:hypothetical protein
MAASFIAAFFKISLCLASISSSLGTGLFPSPVAGFDSGVARFDFCRLPDRRNETTVL